MPFHIKPLLLLWLLTLGLVAGVAPALAIPANDFDKPVLHPSIPLLDEAGQHVLTSGKPYSPRMSCGNSGGGGCHDYDKISHAYHFEQGRDEANDAFGLRRVLDGLTSPGFFGGFNCMQGSQIGLLAKKDNPHAQNFAEWGAAGFLKACSSCHNGGGWEEFDRDGIRYDLRKTETIAFGDGDYYERDAKSKTGLSLFDWKKSGVREADCLTCHADFSSLEKKGSDVNQAGSSSAYAHWGWLQDAKFIKGNFFRYANSAILEFLDLKPNDPAYPDGLNLLAVKRKNFKAGTTYKPDYDLDVDTDGNPQLQWNAAAFDANGKVQIPLLRFPGNDNCMMCHLASSGINRISSGKGNGSRRGFHGFGDDAVSKADDKGIVTPDFKDDVHKGKTWTDDTGETRVMDNCNACHSKQYYKAGYQNVDLDADHNFPKGDGDNDVRRDLDFYSGPLSCEYCHDTAKAPALPSGQKNALDAHRELWIAKGDFAGYNADTLNKITQTHLDVVACQTCHIPSVAQNDTTPLKIRYRYRRGEDGKLKIIPYKPHTRYYAQDKVSGRMLSRYETNPMASLATYEDWKGLKATYEELLKTKGYTKPDVRFIQTESNEYIISHQTRTSPEALQCESCHTRKQDGSYSSLISTSGLLGKDNVAPVIQLPSRRLVDEGIVELGLPYFKVDDKGLVTENVADVLTATLKDPVMSVLKASSAKDFAGEWKRMDTTTALSRIGVEQTQHQQLLTSVLGSEQTLLFDVLHGDPALKSLSLMAATGSLMDSVYPLHRLEVEMRAPNVSEREALAKAKLGTPVSGIYKLTLTNSQNAEKLHDFLGNKALLKLPYRGGQTQLDELAVLTLSQGIWSPANVELLLLQAVTRDQGDDLAGDNIVSRDNPGYLVIKVSEPFESLMVVDKANANVLDSASMTLQQATLLWKKANASLVQAKKTLAKVETKAAKSRQVAEDAASKVNALTKEAASLTGPAKLQVQNALAKAKVVAQKADAVSKTDDGARQAATAAVKTAAEHYSRASSAYNTLLVGG